MGRRDVTHTDDNIRDLVSVVVTRNDGQHVASVTQFSPPRGLLDAGRLNVSGAINTGHKERGYLELVWTTPDASQSGSYSCEVNAMTSQGHNVVFSQTTEVEVAPPTLDDLVQHVHDQGINIFNMKQELDKTRQELSSVKLQLDEARHVENGTLLCGPSTTWTGAGYSKTVTGTFAEVYPTPPIVHLGVVENRVSIHDTYNSYYRVSLVSVGNTSFSIKCDHSGHNYTPLFHALSVQWISVSNK